MFDVAYMNIVKRAPKLRAASVSRSLRLALLAAGAMAGSGCAVISKSQDPVTATRDGVALERAARSDGRSVLDEASVLTPQSSRRAPSAVQVPTISDLIRDAEDEAEATPQFGVDTVDAVVAPLALPDFINVVFGEMLNVPFTTGPGVSERREIVQLRSSGQMSAETFLSLVARALEDYGVRVVTEDGRNYQILEDSSLKSRLPRFIRSRAKASTPANLRPITQFVELNAINAEDMAEILRQAFGERDENLNIEPELTTNYIVLSGLPDDVNSALDMILQMDELQYAGTVVQRYSPTYWTSLQLSNELSRILQAEGWQTSLSPNEQKAILLLSINYSNDLLVFSRTPEARARVSYWLTQLDRPASQPDKDQLFVYNVKHLNASVLARTVNNVMLTIDDDDGSSRRPARPSRANQNEDGGADLAVSTREGSFVVDPAGNRLIFAGDANEYERISSLLEALDQPTPEVLIEVMIAQVTLADAISSGVEFFVNKVSLFNSQPVDRLDGFDLSTGADGIDFSVLPGDFTIEANALATNSQIEILSTPRLVARSGSAAQAQIGAEVPILSAQRLPTGGTSGNTNVDVISSVEYRSTGVILDIEPVVFSDNRIDLTVSQEVSSVAPGGSGINSPTINNTSVTTSLSLEDGQTAVIGGLISENSSRNENGVPFLKDIPVLGAAFSSRDYSVDRQELVILITAYVLRGAEDKAMLAERFASGIDSTLGRDNLLTLRPRTF